MLYEYAQMIINLQEAKLTEVFSVPIVPISLVEAFSIFIFVLSLAVAYLLTRRYFVINSNKGYFQRVIVSSIYMTTLVFFLWVMSTYLSIFIGSALCIGEYCNLGFGLFGLIILAWLLPALVVVFITGLFLFSFKKTDPTKIILLQNLNKTEKKIVWVYFLLLVISFLFYLPSYIYYPEIKPMIYEIKELNVTVEKNEFEFESIKYARKNAKDNEFVCVENVVGNLQLLQTYTILEDEIYVRYEGLSIPLDELVGTVEGDKIIMENHYQNSNCYNNAGEKMYTKYEIIMAEQSEPYQDLYFSCLDYKEQSRSYLITGNGLYREWEELGREERLGTIKESAIVMDSYYDGIFDDCYNNLGEKIDIKYEIVQPEQ